MESLRGSVLGLWGGPEARSCRSREHPASERLSVCLRVSRGQRREWERAAGVLRCGHRTQAVTVSQGEWRDLPRFPSPGSVSPHEQPAGCVPVLGSTRAPSWGGYGSEGTSRAGAGRGQDCFGEHRLRRKQPYQAGSPGLGPWP